MNFTVDWLPDAEQELADIWMNAGDRKAVTQAAGLIDQRLTSDPAGVGESRPNNRRILFSKPLGVIYRIRLAERLVQVVHVWQF